MNLHGLKYIYIMAERKGVCIKCASYKSIKETCDCGGNICKSCYADMAHIRQCCFCNRFYEAGLEQEYDDCTRHVPWECYICNFLVEGDGNWQECQCRRVICGGCYDLLPGAIKKCYCCKEYYEINLAQYIAGPGAICSITAYGHPSAECIEYAKQIIEFCEAQKVNVIVDIIISNMHMYINFRASQQVDGVLDIFHSQDNDSETSCVKIEFKMHHPTVDGAECVLAETVDLPLEIPLPQTLEKIIRRLRAGAPEKN